jgi:[ribosomal protein S18]-alanine N-acetyltransferase
VKVRPAISADVPVMSQLHREASTSAWSYQQYEVLFRSSLTEQAGYFMLVVEDPTGLRNVGESKSRASVVAHLVAHHVLSEWQLQYIVVAKDHRFRGVGTYLMKEFIAIARGNGGTRISLEVRESNLNARHLYNALGFKEAGLRKGYYPNPPEDAILYELSL